MKKVIVISSSNPCLVDIRTVHNADVPGFDWEEYLSECGYDLDNVQWTVCDGNLELTFIDN